jgi:hypothetical protein
MKTILCGSLLIALVLQAADSPASQSGTNAPNPQMALGKELIQQAGGLLSSNLLAAITRGGPTNALEFCSLHALTLTKSGGTNQPVTIRRVTHKPRNPVNGAQADELAVLDKFRAQLQPDKVPGPLLTTNAAGTVSFFAPIVLNSPLCLNCHGQPRTEVQPATLAVVRRLYPRDEATGFKLGELRGLWRVDFTQAAPSKTP